jgi:hypothetical protein
MVASVLEVNPCGRWACYESVRDGLVVNLLLLLISWPRECSTYSLSLPQPLLLPLQPLRLCLALVTGLREYCMLALK